MGSSSIVSNLLVGFSCAFKGSRITPVVAIAALSFLHTAQAAYAISDDFSGDSFFRDFEFFTQADPTNGHVKFTSMTEANTTGIAGFMDGGNATRAIYMGVDTTSQAPDGRGSVRVQSHKSYQHALVVADIVHMPGGVCGTWPAFWMVGDDWPTNGEIDIIEGVNDQTSNQMTLHTSAGAVITKQTTSKSRAAQAFTGSILTTNCDINAPDQSKNAGCAITDESGLTFGADFNANGGGVIATEWTSAFIKIWMFPRGQFPSDISSSQPNPSQNWGPPTSMFAGDFNMDDHFKNLRIVFDTTFCGDWAGNTWNTSTCASLAPTCEEYVSNNPGAFKEAYWAINTLQVFQDNSTSASKPGPNHGTSLQVDKAAISNGRFIKSAALMTKAEDRDFGSPDTDTDTDTSLAPDTGVKSKWVQNPGGSQPRRRNGGAVLPSNNIAV